MLNLFEFVCIFLQDSGLLKIERECAFYKIMRWFRVINITLENLQLAKHKSDVEMSEMKAPLRDLCFANCRFFR